MLEFHDYRMYREHVDPEYQRWGKAYRRFPGVAECVGLIKSRKAKGSWTDIVVDEMARNAKQCHSELMEVFQSEPSASVFALMALEIASLPETVPFFVQILQQDDPRFVPYALRALKAIGTKEARTALRNAKHSKRGQDAE